MIKKPDFLQLDINSLNLKVDWKILGGCGHKLVFRLWFQDFNIDLSHKEINRINWFLVCYYKFREA